MPVLMSYWDVEREERPGEEHDVRQREDREPIGEGIAHHDLEVILPSPPGASDG